jgi:AraC-like DNA-binding protein
MEMIFVAGIGIALLIEFLLITKKDKSGSDILLTIWMFVVVIHLFLFYLYHTQEIYRLPFLLGIESPLPLLHGVFLYLYTASLTDQFPQKKYLLALHFIPALLIYLYLTGFFFLPADEKIQIYRSRGAGHELFNALKQYSIALSGVLYVAWTSLLLKRHRKNIGDQFSNIDERNLQWLRFLTIGMGGIWFLVLAFPDPFIHFIGVVLFIFLIGFFGVRQSGIFKHNDPASSAGEQKKKYPKSGLTNEQALTLHASLRELMQKEAPYRNSDLSIGDLAARLDIHPNYLSQIINEKEGMNFYDFVNTYRIEEFKRLIALPKNRQKTLLSLAFDCGFNSKSSFNRYFKKAAGMTPSEYFAGLTPEP